MTEQQANRKCLWENCRLF